MTILSPKAEGVRNTWRYYCLSDNDKRHRKSRSFSIILILLVLALTIYWLHYRDRQIVLQRVQFIQNENKIFLPRLDADNNKSLMSGEMSHGQPQQGLTFVNNKPVYDAEAMTAFIIGILGSHQPLSDTELDIVMKMLVRDVADEIPYKQMDQQTPCWQTEAGQLLCMPKAYILGFKRAAWSDLFFRLSSHPAILQSWRVEDKFFAYGSNFNFREIVRNYGFNMAVGGYLGSGLLLEGNPDDLLFACEPNLATIDMPRSLLVAQIIKRLTPNAKFVVILRNPVDAALSHYVIRRRPNRDSKEDFHKFIEDLISEVHNITFNEGLDACYGKGHLHESLLYWTYIVYLQDYLSVFPAENFYFIQLEDYAEKSKREIILQELFDFLGVSPLDFDAIRYLSGMEPIDDEARKWYNPDLLDMNASTRELMTTFFQPFNEILAETLNDRTFLWQDETQPDGQLENQELSQPDGQLKNQELSPPDGQLENQELSQPDGQLKNQELSQPDEKLSQPDGELENQELSPPEKNQDKSAQIRIEKEGMSLTIF